VIKLPPSHHDFNLTGKIIGVVKNRVVAKCVTFNL
jgi:hypothetical protein